MYEGQPINNFNKSYKNKAQERFDEQNRIKIEKNRAMLAERQRKKEADYQLDWEQRTGSNTKAPDTSHLTGALSYVDKDLYMIGEDKRYNDKKKANRQFYEEQSRVPTYNPVTLPNPTNNTSDVPSMYEHFGSYGNLRLRERPGAMRRAGGNELEREAAI